MTPQIDPDLNSRYIGTRLYQEDLDAIEILQKYLKEQPWFLGRASVTTAIRFALRQSVATLVAQHTHTRKESKRGRKSARN